jgi:hypothetical protein
MEYDEDAPLSSSLVTLIFYGVTLFGWPWGY